MTLRELWTRTVFPLRRRRLERELREEMDFHLALRAERLREGGLPSAQAAAAAQKRFGNRSRLLVASHEAWGAGGWHWLDGFGQDLRYIGRQLRRTPGFALVAVLTIALGIGINATAFTFYDAIVLKPLPVRDPGHMVRLERDQPVPNPEELPYSAYDVLRSHARTVQDVVATTGPQTLSAVLPGHARDDARLLSARFVSADFFRTLGVHARFGRVFDAGEPAVVLDYGFWANVLGADPGIIGKQIVIQGNTLTIAGVAPEQFAGTGLPALAPQLWIPMSLVPALVPGADWQHDGRLHWQVLGRTAGNASLTQVASELAALRASVRDTVGKPLPLVAKHATFFQSDAGEFAVFQQVSAALMVALGLILGIAVVNLVNLLAARNAAREREVAVRLALGASRARIARQLASESVLLAVAGGALGLAVSGWFASWLRAWIIETMATVSAGVAGIFFDLTLDWRVVAYTVLLSGAIGLGVGVWPALRAARGDANGVLRQGTTSTAGVAAWGKRNVLLALQVAGSLVLLTAAGMLLGGARLAPEIDPGFDARHMVVVRVLDGGAPIARRAAERADIERRIAALPEVRAVAWSRRFPFGGTHLHHAVTADGPVTISIDNVSEHYFEAMGMPILHGRTFTRAEVEANAPVMVVSASLARVHWPGQDPIGRSVTLKDVLVASAPDTTRSYTVIGVVPDVRTNFLSRVNAPSVYYPHGLAGDFGSFLVRTRGAPSTALNALRLAAAGASPSAASQTHVMTMQDGPMSVQRLFAQAPAMVALVLALTGLVLASVGVYGLISQIVARRTREIGVHVALGARPAQVIRLVVRKTLRPVAWGALVGGFGAFGMSVLLSKLIAAPDTPDLTFGAGAFNPMVFLGVVTVIGTVVAAACYAPARRAATLDPTAALRVE